ncbi:MAG: hypothetical protein ISR69_14305 [Gammaproteobacteria bacterium]|nr:hypothetical protein [Gammaproteobacteria bacterium]
MRESIVRNENTPCNILEELSTGDSEDVRMGVSENDNTPGSILENLELRSG